ncbi:alpha/beta hydrolase [Nakamurella antarctica]|uniref:Alpha/beta hydrolase n=1 Tax=Nakamurella antarctica TaxID=1902245 RepID=A0A3G8ZPE2_9ACTN|nr:alpha/beta hydrolase [Nakamurella antarctica]AZI58655.1 alpha/beta hydrolase [Nakamurella antarctica]
MSVVSRALGAGGVVLGVVGAAALGGITAQRAAMKKYRAVTLEAADQFDALPVDRSYSVLAEDGALLHVEETGPADAPLTVVFAHGWALRLGAWHFQRLGLAGPDFGATPGIAAAGIAAVKGVAEKSTAAKGLAEKSTASKSMASKSMASKSVAGKSAGGTSASRAPQVRMVFYDHRSHGLSGKSKIQHPTMTDLAADLAAVIATCAPTGPLVLVGHSMGGMALLALAGINPGLFRDRVVGVGLLCTSVSERPNPQIKREFLHSSNALVRVVAATAVRYPGLLERGRASTRDAVWLLTRAIGFARKDVSGALVDYLDDMLTGTSIQVIADFVPAIVSHDQIASLAHVVGIPVLVLAGDADRITPAQQSVFIANALPDAELVIVERAGHLAPLEAPEETNDALRRLLHRSMDLAAIRTKSA